MRAIVIRAPGGPEVLELREKKAPDLLPSHLRVRVSYAGVNRADLLQRMGLYPAPPGVPADIPGLEYVGSVEEVGAGVTRFAPGSRVFGLVGGGAYAEQVLVHEREAVQVPEGLDDERAAAVPEAFVTAYDALVVRGRLAPGDRVLVHAAGSGVGTAGVQIARALGCLVVGTSRTREKLERCRPLGLSAGITPERGKFAEQVRQATGGAGVDVVLDLVGGPYLPETLAACAPRARVIVVGLTAGRTAEIDLGLVLSRRLEIIGTALRSRPLEEKIEAALLLERRLCPWLASGAVRPIIDKVFGFAEVAEAHNHVAADRTFGKVLLRWLTWAGSGRPLASGPGRSQASFAIREVLMGVFDTRSATLRSLHLLATLLSLGSPLDSAVMLVARLGENRHLRSLWERIHEQLFEGQSLSGALFALREEGPFPAPLVALLEVGEMQGEVLAALRAAAGREVFDAYRVKDAAPGSQPEARTHPLEAPVPRLVGTVLRRAIEGGAERVGFFSGFALRTAGPFQLAIAPGEGVYPQEDPDALVERASMPATRDVSPASAQPGGSEASLADSDPVRALGQRFEPSGLGPGAVVVGALRPDGWHELDRPPARIFTQMIRYCLFRARIPYWTRSDAKGAMSFELESTRMPLPLEYSPADPIPSLLVDLRGVYR